MHFVIALAKCPTPHFAKSFTVLTFLGCVALAVAVSSCSDAALETPGSKPSFSQRGWLITKLSGDNWGVTAAGVGRYAWLWKRNERGVWCVDIENRRSITDILNGKPVFEADGKIDSLKSSPRGNGFLLEISVRANANEFIYHYQLISVSIPSGRSVAYGTSKATTIARFEHWTTVFPREEGHWFRVIQENVPVEGYRYTDKQVVTDIYFLAVDSDTLWHCGTLHSVLVPTLCIRGRLAIAAFEDLDGKLSHALLQPQQAIRPLKVKYGQEEGFAPVKRRTIPESMDGIWHVIREGDRRSRYYVDASTLEVQGDELPACKFDGDEITGVHPLEDGLGIGYSSKPGAPGVVLLDGRAGTVSGLLQGGGYAVLHCRRISSRIWLIFVGGAKITKESDSSSREEFEAYVFLARRNNRTMMLTRLTELDYVYNGERQIPPLFVYTSPESATTINAARGYYRLREPGAVPEWKFSKEWQEAWRATGQWQGFWGVARDEYEGGRYHWLLHENNGRFPSGLSVWDRQEQMTAGRHAKWSLLPHVKKIVEVVQVGSGPCALVDCDNEGLYLVNLDQPQITPAIQFADGAKQLDANCATDRVLLAGEKTSIRFIVADDVAGVADITDKRVECVLKVSRTGSMAVAEWVSLAGQQHDPRNGVSLAPNPPPPSGPSMEIVDGEPHSVSLSWKDTYGSDIVWVWDNVTFKRINPPISLYETPWVRSLFALAIVIVLSLGARALLRNWRTSVDVVNGLCVLGMPLAATYVGGIDVFVFFVALGGIVGISIASVFVSPLAFRALASKTPFEHVAPFVARSTYVQRRLLGGYVKRLSDRLDYDRRQASNENYWAIPARVARVLPPDEFEHVDAPSDEAFGAIQGRRALPMKQSTTNAGRTPGPRSTLIVAPGGRGKSALLREVVSLSIKSYRDKAINSLPIYCDGGDGSLYVRAKSALGVDGFNDSLFRHLLENGTFYFVIDGFSESNITPQLVEDHLAEYGGSVPLLVSTRPIASLLNVFGRHGQSCTLIEPCKLDDATVAGFAKTYGGQWSQIDEEVRSACKERDGTYLPILVRLAVLAGQVEERTVRGVYAATVGSLLNPHGDASGNGLRDSAVQLCVAGYGATGSRSISYDSACDEQRSLLDKLLKTGLLIPADRNPADPNKPITVRFFHDTVQDYLTAIGLSQDQQWKNLFQRAAGFPGFDADQSGVTDVFRMCLLVKERDAELRTFLADSLEGFSFKHGGKLTRDWCVENADYPGVDVDKDEAGGSTLRKCMEKLRNDPSVFFLGCLYARVVRKYWHVVGNEEVPPRGA